MPEPMPEEISEQIVAGIDPGGIGGVDLVLSALPSSIAGPVEIELAKRGSPSSLTPASLDSTRTFPC